jgi:hypothetical protein
LEKPHCCVDPVSRRSGEKTVFQEIDVDGFQVQQRGHQTLVKPLICTGNDLGRLLLDAHEISAVAYIPQAREFERQLLPCGPQGDREARRILAKSR